MNKNMILVFVFSIILSSGLIMAEDNCSEEYYNYTLQPDSFSVGYANYRDATYDSSDNTIWTLNDVTAGGRYENNTNAGIIWFQDRQFINCQGIADDPRDDTMWLLCEQIVDLDPSREYNNTLTWQLVHFDKSTNVLSQFRVDEHGIIRPQSLVFDPTDNSFWVHDYDFYGRWVYHFDSEGNNLSDGFYLSHIYYSMAFDPRDNTFWMARGHGDNMIHFDKSGNALSPNTYSEGAFSIAECDNAVGLAFDTSDNSFWCLQENTGQDWFYHFARLEEPCTDNDNDGYKTEGGLCGPIDCNDNNPNINPGEYDSNCNNIDDNCNILIDEAYVNTPTTCGIGECLGNSGELSCFLGVEVDTCNPFEGAITETCNGLDDDCEGNIDNSLTFLDYFLDNDVDFYGNPFIFENACSQPISYVLDNTDCDDDNQNINPGMNEICGNGIDDNCNDEIDEECAVCGNGICEGYTLGKDCSTCPSDCLKKRNSCCGNLICEKGENVRKCPVDCE